MTHSTGGCSPSSPTSGPDGSPACLDGGRACAWTAAALRPAYRPPAPLVKKARSPGAGCEALLRFARATTITGTSSKAV
jgi:hypothetical protein